MTTKKFIGYGLGGILGLVAAYSGYEILRPSTGAEKAQMLAQVKSELGQDIDRPSYDDFSSIDPTLPGQYKALRCYSIGYQPSDPSDTDEIQVQVNSKTMGRIPQSIQPQWDGQNCDGRTEEEALRKAQRINAATYAAAKKEIAQAWSVSVDFVYIENPEMAKWGECMRTYSLTQDDGTCGRKWEPTHG